MKKKVIWLVVSCLMVAALLLAACAPAAAPEEEEKPAPAAPAAKEEEEEAAAPAVEEEVVEEGKEMVSVTLTRMDGTTMGKTVEKPRYGGMLNMVWADDIRQFDQIFGHPWWGYSEYLTHNVLVTGDWALGPAGTGELSWAYFVFPELEWLRGKVAESWEIVDDATVIFHIRKGVRFHEKEPYGTWSGREMTAEDVAFSLERLWFPEPANIYMNAVHLESVEVTDKYTVTVKIEPGKMGTMYRHLANYPRIEPKDAVEEFGDMNKWENAIGTGPFMLIDHVIGSSATFVRNPNYWEYDPVHPENQLPYLDGVKYLIIPDLSTQQAALRTAKVDWMPYVGWEEATTLLKTSPELKYLRTWNTLPATLAWRVDKPELPFYDIRVRQALWMAVNHEEIAEEYYGGNADMYAFPILNIPEFKDFDIPYEEWSDTVKDMFGYHPDKAREMLAEAGYPDGFKTTIVIPTDSADFYSIIKAYWAEVGVELILDAREYGAYIGAVYARQYDVTTWSTDASGPQFMSRYRTGHVDNAIMVSDPYLDEKYEEVVENFFNAEGKAEIFREVHPYMREKAYYLGFPSPASYTFWWPWLKNYEGEYAVGTWSQRFNFPTWIWIDQDLKEAMTGRR